MILLTDEEKDRIRLEWYGDDANTECRMYSDLIAMSAKSQLKKVADEWDNAIKPLIIHSSGAEGYSREWVKKWWQTILEEVGE